MFIRSLLGRSRKRGANYHVLLASMERSGSTWLYNAARVLISHHVGRDFGSGWIGDMENIHQNKHMLIKLHHYASKMTRWSSHILYSHRDVRDVLASRLRIWNTQPSMNYVDKCISKYYRYLDVADLVVPYHDIISDKQIVVRSIGQSLGISDFNSHDICDEIASLNYFTEGKKHVHNEINLFHKGHITDGRSGTWKDQVDPGLIREIEAKYRDWFIECGLPLSAI
jgi:hypothetical protein